MYKEIFKPLSKEQIKLLNHSALGEAFKCSHTYVTRVLKSTEEPKAPKAKNILKAAREMINALEIQAKEEEDRLNAIEAMAEKK
jgi:histidinol phosphatase-like PHP family hydrolase